MRRKLLPALLATLVLTATAYMWAVLSPAGGAPRGHSIRGAGTTILEGGTGAPSFTPVTTKLAFHWESGRGDFECLALAPSSEAGKPGSGNFDTNVMYVTGRITSADVEGRTATLKGRAEVTGLGAGSNEPFVLTAQRGGPGTPVVLTVSGLTFKEIVLEGEIRF